MRVFQTCLGNTTALDWHRRTNKYLRTRLKFEKKKSFFYLDFYQKSACVPQSPLYSLSRAQNPFSVTFKGLFEKGRDKLRYFNATSGQRSVWTSQISNIVTNEALGIARALKTQKRMFCSLKKSSPLRSHLRADFLAEQNVRLSVLGARAMPNASFATIFEI